MERDIVMLSCVTCNRNNATYQCTGCRQSFCFNHLNDHNRQLVQQMNDVDDQRSSFDRSIRQYQQDASQNPLMEQINQWEANSIRLIQQAAQETRNAVGKVSTGYLENIEISLTKLAEQMKDLQEKNDFNEIHLNNWKIELDRLQKQVHLPDDVEIKEDSVLIKKINVILASRKPLNPVVAAKGSLKGVKVAGGNDKGSRINQLNSARGIDIDQNHNIYIADYANHRIVKWRENAIIGRTVVGGNDQEGENNSLKNPVDVIIDRQNDTLIIADYGNRRVVRWSRQFGRSGETIIPTIACWGLALNSNGDLYVVDYEKHEVRRWKRGEHEGALVAGGNEKGKDLNQLSQPRFVCVSNDESVYVSDCGNNRVVKWTKDATEGTVVAGGNGNGNDLRQLSSPQGIFVDESETVYVADGENDRVVRWLKGAEAGEVVIGGNGRGTQLDQLDRPTDLCFDGENNLYVGEYGNHRVQKFVLSGNEEQANGYH